MNELDKDIKMLDSDDYFLDNVTGDMYQFHYDSRKWIAKFNTGIHYQKAAEEFNLIGKYMLTAPQHQAHAVNPQTKLYISKSSELICFTKKIYLQHWALASLPFEFLVPCKTPWAVHSFNFVDEEMSFNVMASSNRGAPLIIMFTDENILATQFNVSRKYKETVIPMRNFIVQKLRQLKEQMDNYAQSILNQNELTAEKRARQISLLEGHLVNQLGIEHIGDLGSHVQKQQGVRHSGFTVKRRGRFIVDNNAVGGRRTIIMDIKKHKTRKRTGGFGHGSATSSKISSGFKGFSDKNSQGSQLSGYGRGMNGEGYSNFGGKDSISESAQSQESSSEVTDYSFLDSASGPNFQRQLQQLNKANKIFPMSREENQKPKNVSMFNSSQSQNGLEGGWWKSSNESHRKTTQFNKALGHSSSKIRRDEELKRQSMFMQMNRDSLDLKGKRNIILPEYNGEHLEEHTDSWVPGYQTLSMFSSTKKQPIKLIRNHSRPYCRFKEFMQMDQGLVLLKDAAQSMTSVTSNTAYLTENDLRKLQQKEEDKKIIGGKAFKPGCSNVLKDFEIKNYVNLGKETTSSIRYQFREKPKKEAWVAKVDFKVA